MSAEQRLVKILTALGDPDGAIDAAQDLAWSHATSVARTVGEEIGSDDFVAFYNRYLDRYSTCTDHSNFLFHTALRTLREIAEGPISIMPGIDDAESIAVISEVTHIMVSAMMWAFASYPEGWIPDAEWEGLPLELRVVEFPLTQPTQERESNATDAE